MTHLNDLTDSASLLIYPMIPALTSEQQTTLVTALQQLTQTFAQEGTVAAIGVEPCARTSAIVIAYDRADQGGSCSIGTDLSGCRKSKITSVLAHHETLFGRSLLDTAPIVIQHNGEWCGFTRAQLKPFVQAGDIGMASLASNVRSEHLGQWRAEACIAIADMWLAPLIERMGKVG